MVSINKEEKRELQARFPRLNIVRTMKSKSKRGHYLVESSPKVMNYLNEIRNKNVVEEHYPVQRRTESNGK